MSMSPLAFAFSLTLLAGMATGLGAAIAFFARRTDYRFLGIAMGFSAGVMLYVSFTEILGKAHTSMAAAWGPRAGAWGATISFFVGIGLIALVDALIPKADNPHEVRDRDELSLLNPSREVPPHAGHPDHKPLLRTGLFAALAIGIHNFPEGLATFLAALQDPSVGIALAVAVALHNIPEGISVSVPIYFATGSRRRAFFYSALSGLAEPVGAIVGSLRAGRRPAPTMRRRRTVAAWRCRRWPPRPGA